MSIETQRSTATASVSVNVSEFLERILDKMPITERAYHHLNYNLPLVANIVERARDVLHPGDKVLLIGGNALLGNALLEMECDMDIWRFPQGEISAEMESHVQREISPTSLANCELSDANYKLIIAPFVLESLEGTPAGFFRNMRGGLAHDGVIIVATTNLSRIETRFAALLGRRFSVRREAAALSLSWPALPTVQDFHRDDLIHSAGTAGLVIKNCDYVAANRTFMEMEPLSVGTYAMRKAGRAFRMVVPATRDTLIAELSNRVAHDAARQTNGQPRVSVIVAGFETGQQLSGVVSCLQRQTYPLQLLDVIIVHDGTRPDLTAVVEGMADSTVQMHEMVVPGVDGPALRNRAISEATGEIVAHTDGACELPADWVEAAVARFDEDIAAITGPVFAAEGSEPRFYDVPTLRPDPDDKGVWRDNLFPISNIFHRRDVVRPFGGFNEAYGRNGSAPAPGWDADLSWRLRRAGWQARFHEEVYVFRKFPVPDRNWPKQQFSRAAALPRLCVTIPELADETLHANVFASRQTMYFNLMVAAASLATFRRNWRWLFLALPWFGAISQRLDLWPPREWKRSVRTTLKLGLLHVVWLGGFIKGSIRARRIVL
jgi:glycosyltransferase involved in cell wall biosynthesis